MKFTKIFLFTILAIFSLGFIYNEAQAITGSGSVTVTVVNPSGSISATDCTIALNASTCTSSVSWSSSNIVSGSSFAVTHNNPSNTSVSSSKSGSQSVSITNGFTDFYIYNNSVELASATATASCVSDSSWDSSSKTCKASTVTPITVSISANPAGPLTATGSTSLTWTTTNSPSSCTASNSWSGTKASSGGSESRTGMTAGTYHFDVTCSKTGLSDAIDSVSVVVNSDSNVTSGTLTGDNCEIAKNGNTCTTKLTLSITNPVSGVATNITKPTNVEVATGITPASKSNIVVNYPSTTFYLNHDSKTLAEKKINAICVSGTGWDLATSKCIEDGGGGTCSDGIKNQNETGIDTGGVCAVNGSCSSTHFSCLTGTSANNVSNDPSKWKWNCNGLKGGTNASCTESKVMSGSLTSSSPSCIISSGSSSCTVNLSWSVTNPLGSTTEITANGMTDYTSPSVSGGGPRAFTVPYSSRTFYLYNNYVLLAQTTVTSSYAPCPNGATNPPACTIFPPVDLCPNVPGVQTTLPCPSEDKCPNTPGIQLTLPCPEIPPVDLCPNTPGVQTTLPCPSSSPIGTLTGDNCEIAKNGNTCTTTLTLNITNPVSGAATNITKPTNVEVATGITPASKSNIVVNYPSTTFYLNHNSDTLASRTINATCVSGTGWSSSEGKCIVGDGTGGDGGTGNGTGGNGDGDGTGGDGGTGNGTNGNGGNVLNINFTAIPSKIFKGKSSVLAWTSTLGANCTAVSAPEFGIFSTGTDNPYAGNTTVYPTKTTRYKISCTKSNITETDEVTVQVNSISVIEI